MNTLRKIETGNPNGLALFYKLLMKETGNYVFNPWQDQDPQNDLKALDARAPERRLDNLKRYLSERTDANYLLLAEAVGYQGGHFTGIPMTSERIILGHKSDIGILPGHVCKSKLHRTSNQQKHKDGFNEPTATIVWKKIIEEDLDTRNFIFWNAYPWHPYKGDKGLLSNRTPSISELKQGEIVLQALLSAFRFKKIIALGNKSHTMLNKLNITSEKVRHPAMGGAELFRQQFLNIINEE